MRSVLPLVPLLLLLALIAPAQPLPRILAKPHLHVVPPAPLPQPQPTDVPQPTYVFDPILIATALASALAAGTLGWFLADLRRKRLLASLTAQLAEALRHRQAAETALQTLKTETRQQKSDRRESWLLAQAEREQTDVANTTNQLRFVAEATLVPQELLNDEERIVFFAALRAIKATNDTLGSTHYSLALQVSMGEFLATVSAPAGKDLADRAYSSINCKRSDLLIYTRRDFLPALVIEHQGSGHDQGNARDRDAVKRAALARARILLLETDSTNPATLFRQITEKLATIVPSPQTSNGQPPSRT